jgi:RNA polymerase sigma-70 factor (ECF subfamily)
MSLRLVKPAGSVSQAPSRADALDELYDSYAADVFRWARRLAGPTADTEDIVHDVFVVALQRGFTFQGGATVRTWLFRITHHVVSNRRRRSFLRRLLFAQRRDEMVAGLSSPATPHQEMEKHEDHARLYRALDRLPDLYRTSIILYEIDGLSSDEIADLTGVSVGTVWARLHRGKAKLLEHLNAEKGT